ncbi:MAG: ABC transporter permease [Cardiobacteriaceae bacterium]|nr:ABC transporter permease [Cardiobacteriaceae bacterium]
MLSLAQVYGAVSSGLIFALVAFAIYLSFRVLDFPDLTVDGSFPLGAGVAAVVITAGYNPWLACLAGFAAGMLAGCVTALLHVRWGIMNLLSSILVMTALYSINLRVMGAPNISLYGSQTILTGYDMPLAVLKIWVFLAVIVVVLSALWWFMHTEIGLAMRATGANPSMARAQGINAPLMIILGIALSNGLVGLAGSLMAQNQSYADAQMGVGTIVVGLAALIGGEAVLSPKSILRALLACVLGAILYRLAIALALNAKWLGLKTQDFSLVTAMLVTCAIVLSDARRKWKTKSQVKASDGGEK